ncbi:ATP-binding protein [Streptomyces sp. NPDC016845]|uniref:ATP-binding protein n=1 Tax=Streptomyces sp. NPDC016845 TaxID=3364972 RepID=UPI00379DD57A
MSVPGTPAPERTTCAQARAEVSWVLLEVCCGLPLEQARRLHDDALLVATELTSNAIRHAGGTTAFGAGLSGDSLWMSVSDHSVEVPRRISSQARTPGGFGWMVVQRLSSQVMVDVAGNGKTITAELRLPAAPGGSGGL